MYFSQEMMKTKLEPMEEGGDHKICTVVNAERQISFELRHELHI